MKTIITEKEWRNEFSKNLKNQIKRNNITQESLSELSKISRRSINKYAIGNTTPSSYHIAKLAKVLNCDLIDLIGSD